MLRDGLAIAAEEALAQVLDHHTAGRDPLQGLGPILTDRAKPRPAAAGAGGRSGLDDAFARRVLGHRPTGRFALGGRCGGVRRGFGQRLLPILQRQCGRLAACPAWRATLRGKKG